MCVCVCVCVCARYLEVVFILCIHNDYAIFYVYIASDLFPFFSNIYIYIKGDTEERRERERERERENERERERDGNREIGKRNLIVLSFIILILLAIILCSLGFHNNYSIQRRTSDNKSSYEIQITLLCWCVSKMSF